MNTSYWERESFLQHFDALVVGAGIAGLSAAIELKLKDGNSKIAVLEKSWLSDGASSKNAGFACFGSISEFIDDLKDLSFDEVLALAVMRFRGIQKLVKDYSVESMNLEWNGGYEVFFQEDEQSFLVCCEQVDRFNDAFESQLGIRPYSVLTVSEFQGIKNLCGVISNKYEGGLNTGLLLQAMRARAVRLGIQVFQGVEVSNYVEKDSFVEVESSVGNWRTQQLAFCTSSFHAELFAEESMHSKRNQVIVTKPIEGLKLNGTFHHQQGFNYFRNIDGRILMGGMRHLFPHTESTSVQGTTAEVIQSLVEFIQNKIYTSSSIEIDMAWSGILGVGEDERPLIKQVSHRIFIGARLGGIGVAVGSLIGEELATLMHSSSK